MRHLLPAFALAATITTPALANPDADHLDEVVVTAVRRATTIDEVSAALSIVGRDDILAEKLVTDALSDRVGVFLQQTTPGQGAPIIRGLKGSAILQLVDGIPLSNAITRSAPTPYLALVPSIALERIEVIRGTPASLYGSQAVGGVIQVVTHVPQFDTDATEWRRYLAIAFDTAELLQSIKGSVDIGHQTLAASLSGEYLTTGDRRIGGGERIAPSGYSAKAARFVVRATPSQSRSWLFDLHWLEQPDTPRIDELVPGFGQTRASSSEFSFTPSRRLFAHAQYLYGSGWLGLDWQLDAGWQQIDDDRTNRDFESTIRFIEMNSSRLTAINLNASGGNEAMSWVVGTDIHTDRVHSARSEEDIDTHVSNDVASRFPDGARLDQLALFGNISSTLSDRNILSGGLRFTTVRIDFADIDVSRLSGDIGWIHSLDNDWQLVANAGFGFRAPNVFDLGTLGERPGNRFNIPNTDLDEETVQQFDAGIRKGSGKVQLELMLYTLQFDDRITSVLTGDVNPSGRDIVQSVNAANSRIHGAEMGLNIQLSTSTQLAAVLDYTWGEESVGADSPQPADRIPPLSGKITIQTDWNHDWRTEGWLSYAGTQNRLSDRDIRDSRINPDGTAGWAMLGVKALWTANDFLAVEIIVNNLLDRRYRMHGSGIDAAGRNFGITMRASW